MTTRKFYKTTITLEVLSEEPLGPSVNMESIAYEATNGELSMNVVKEVGTVLNGKEIADALIEQGSDPEFFRVTEDGEDVE